jgi:hypothetical protein
MRITLAIPTHCIKTETRGLYNGVNNVVPSTPSTRMIEFVIEDFLHKTNLTPNDVTIHVGFDKRKGRTIDEQYHSNLSVLSSKYPNYMLIVNESESDDDSDYSS